MRCPKCDVTMEKDPYTRTAKCPLCGKVKHYKTRGDKNREKKIDDELALSFLKECWSTLWEKITTIVTLIVFLVLAILFVIYELKH